MMSQSQGQYCLLPNSHQSSVTPGAASHSAVLVLENNRLVGILTERDLVKLTATQTDLRGMSIAAVMTQQLHTLVWSAEQTVIDALNILNHYRIRHLPVLDTQGQLLGIITPDHIRQVLQPTDLLKFRSVQEGMTTNVIHAPTSSTILQISQLMVAHRISSIVIVDGAPPLRPVGIITEKDVVQFQVLELDLAQLTAGAVMSSPLFCLSPADSLWSAQQVMASRRIRRLVITGAEGELQGIVTQSNLLRSFDPLEMIKVVDSLQAQLTDRAKELEQINGELRAEVARRQQVESDLHRANQHLAERVAARMAESDLLKAELQAKITEQQSCDIALEISQQGISDFMENALIGMHWFDFRTNSLGEKEGTIVWANQAELDMLGYDRQEYLGQPLIDFHVDQETIRNIFQRLLNNEPIKGCAAQMRRKDGSICHVSIDANAFFKDGKFIHARCFTRDISDQKNAEAAFRQSEQRFRAIFDNTFQFIGLLDVNGIVLEANRTALEAIAATPADVIGQAFWLTPWWTHSPDLQNQLQQAVIQAATGQLVRFEAKHFLADGSYITVDFSLSPIIDEIGKVIMLIPEGRDISSRKAAEQKIQEQASLLDVTTDAIIVRDLNNQVQFWNKGAESIYGWSATEIIGLTTRQFFQTDISPEVILASEIVRKEGTWQGELRQLTKTGEEVIVASRWTLIRNEADHPKSILSVDTDITNQKLLEQQFLRVQRLESLGTLATGIAHDLNNVLTPIVGIAQLLPNTLPNLDERNQRLLNMLVESSRRGSNLVKQILTFARGLDGQRTVLQVRHILAEIISVARQTFPRSIEIILDLDTTDLWLVSVDATQIHQVLMNLFVNARDAMPNGGSITATAKNLVLNDTETTVPINPPAGSYVVITVTDTGVGIDSEAINKIFNPFFTTKETGTGLGLSTVLGIIKAHNGFIDVHSEVGQGTCFTMYLPAIKSNEEEQLPEQQSSFDGHQQLVLVVDDELAICHVVKDSLESYNYRVVLASDGVAAIALYAQNPDKIAMVLVDMMMPDLDTPSIILALQQINPAVQIVAMSGSGLNELVVAKYGLKAFLGKPFTTIEMLQTLATVGVIPPQ